VTIRGLGKRYGSAVVVDRLDFDVSRGEMVGVADADGARKTITVECIQGLLFLVCALPGRPERTS
jgi:ABC-2 type transport system ATP-binding protein